MAGCRPTPSWTRWPLSEAKLPVTQNGSLNTEWQLSCGQGQRASTSWNLDPPLRSAREHSRLPRAYLRTMVKRRHAAPWGVAAGSGQATCRKSGTDHERALHLKGRSPVGNNVTLVGTRESCFVEMAGAVCRRRGPAPRCPPARRAGLRILQLPD
jgi:hypothetical protein